MNRILTILFAGFIMGAFVGPQAYGLTLSDMQVKITPRGHTAIFRMYDTVAAKEFYDQLPLKLDLSNFRDAQWMFYPPEKLSVTAREAYHDGKKGELSYYAPWGDVVMFYGNFGSAPGLCELGHAVSGSEYIKDMSGAIRVEKGNDP